MVRSRTHGAFVSNFGDQVGRDLRARIVQAFGQQGLSVQPPPPSGDGTADTAAFAREADR